MRDREKRPEAQYVSQDSLLYVEWALELAPLRMYKKLANLLVTSEVLNFWPCHYFYHLSCFQLNRTTSRDWCKMGTSCSCDILVYYIRDKRLFHFVCDVHILAQCILTYC